MNNLKISNQQVTLVDQVEDKLLSFFKSHDLQPGDAIPKEQDLSEALGVGRSVLREALSRLRMLGMIETRTRRGMVITEPSLLGGMKRVVDPRILSDENLFNILGFRIALEIGICGLIFQNLTDCYIDELEQIVNRGVVFENNEYTPVSEYEFHAKLYEISGNKTIAEFQEIIRPVSVFTKQKFKDLIEPINKELKQENRVVTHNELLRLLKNRDKPGFQHALEEHFAPYFLLFNRKITNVTDNSPINIPEQNG
jgi:GntR family transcriptional regulator, transcriptional repressor for pyruvate dehydrogenase complex